MPSWKTPTADQLTRVRTLVVQPGQYRYFFDKLENPLWVDPLRSAGFFAQPPEPERNEAEGTIGFPPWPESRYLARMAEHEVAHDSLIRVLDDLPETDNERVLEDAVEVMLRLPASSVAHLAPKAAGWARKPLYLLLPGKLSELVVHLVEGGEHDAGFELVAALLEPRPDPRSGEEGGESALLRPTPRPRFRLWSYQQELAKLIPALTEADARRTLRLFATFLACSLKFSRRPGERHFDDGSWIWRPSIADHDQNRSDGLNDVLVTAVRDIAVELARRGEPELQTVLDVLGRHQWTAARRLALHVVAQAGDPASDLVQGFVLDETLFREISVRHEYAVLLAKAFPVLSADSSALVLGWIHGGPDLTHYRASRGEVDEDEVQRYARRWIRDWLAEIREHLDDRDSAVLAELEQELGPSSGHSFILSVGRPTWVGPTSPIDSPTLAEMTVEELVAYMRDWEPTEGWREASAAGLGRELAKLVKDDPARFASSASAFRGLDPTYMRELFSALKDAHKAGTVFDWEPVLELGAWVVSQSREGPERRGDPFDRDPHWGWARKALLALVSAGMEGEAAPLDIQHRPAVWAIIASTMRDPDPTPAHEEQYGGTNMDPATLSINTTRGEAVHTAVKYGLWVRRQLEHDGVAGGFDSMPELREALQERLEEDPSFAVRAVFGQWLPWLVLLDEHWVIEHLAAIFPNAEEDADYWFAAWTTYIAYCSLYKRPFELLLDEYTRAITRLGTAGERPVTRLQDPEQQLAEHLIIAFARGWIELEEGSLLHQFFGSAGAALRRHALRFVGKSLSGADEVPPEMVARFRELWTWRKASLAPDPDEELSGFGAWPTAAVFDADWALTELVEVLEQVGEVDSAHLLVEVLTERAETDPVLSVRALHLLLIGDKQGWHIHSWSREIRTILSRASASGAHAAVREVVDWLGKRGHLAYRDLLSPPA